MHNQPIKRRACSNTPTHTYQIHRFNYGAQTVQNRYTARFAVLSTVDLYSLNRRTEYASRTHWAKCQLTGR